LLSPSTSNDNSPKPGPDPRAQALKGRLGDILMMDQNFVVLRTLTQQRLDRIGSQFRTAIPVSEDAEFDDLLAAIDAAESRSAHRRL